MNVYSVYNAILFAFYYFFFIIKCDLSVLLMFYPVQVIFCKIQ